MTGTPEITTLENGLRVASKKMPGVKSVAISVWVDVGARYETDINNGISHFMEHMAFKGTETRSALDIAITFDAIGGHLNAYTSMEHTVYYAKVLQKDMPLALGMLADILQHSVFDAEEVEHERQVILQEIAMHHDTPDDLVYDHYTQVAYPGQGIGRPVLGTHTQVSSFQPEDLKAFLKQHYNGRRMVLAVAGDVDHAELVKLAEQAFAGLQAGEPAEKEPVNYTGGSVVTEDDLEQLHLVMGFEGLPYQDEAYFAQQMLATMLGGGMSSRLFQEVREKRGLAYTIQAFASAYADTGLFSIYSGTAEKDAATLMEVVMQELKQFSATMTEEEFTRAKDQLRSGLLMSRETVSSESETIGRHLMCYGRYLPIEEVIRKVEAVTEEDVRRVLQQMLSEKPMTFAALGPCSQLPSYDSLKQELAA